MGPEAARGEIVAQLQGLLGNDGAAAIQALLESASKPEEGLLATITSVLLLLLGATTIFAVGLSQARRAADESEPTNGTPRNSRRPRRAPSSPEAPWSAGHTTSGRVSRR